MNAEDRAWGNWIFERARRYRDIVPGTTILYLMELSCPDGAHYFLIQEKHHSHDDIMKAKSMARQKWDVTGFTVIKMADCEEEVSRG